MRTRRLVAKKGGEEMYLVEGRMSAKPMVFLKNSSFLSALISMTFPILSSRINRAPVKGIGNKRGAFICATICLT